MGAAGAAIRLSQAGGWLNCAGRPSLVTDFSPIIPVDPFKKQTSFTGDDPSRPHSILWDKQKFLQANPPPEKPERTVDVAIVGGGMSGLSAAYALKDLKPVILEQSDRFGGNSKGERWDDLAWSIGAAYITTPEKGSDEFTLLTELGLMEKGRMEQAEEGATVLKDRTIRHGFWKGVTDPARADEFKGAWRFFRDIYDNRYPEIPPSIDGPLSPEEFNRMDGIPFKQWIKDNLKPLHPHVEEFLAEYCWSSFGAGADEISAGQGLSFVASDLSGTVAFPGGNAAITEALVERLKKELPSHHLIAGVLAIDVTAQADGVFILYQDTAGRMRSIKAKKCIVASPKFVAKHLVSGLGVSQREAMNRLRYRAYLVANLPLKKKFPSPSYELFRLTGEVPADNREDSKKRPFTDLIFGSWAAGDHPKHSVLTLYKAYPFDGGRTELYVPDAYSNARTEFEKGIPEILKALSLNADDLLDIRITRWGHALPVAETGLIADGTVTRASQPLQDRIFFANQDNWANPCFETALASANEAARMVRGSLK
ncbi:MAG: FAD-dependent oxidoreductase [Deltaproteobacteria bacterium]|nr:FAD-dependent oxidoreductase [Deltaproteobacteria bacterium]